MSCSPRGAMHSCPRSLAALFDTKARLDLTHHRNGLAPATGRQDHTILPYAGLTARCARGSRSRLSRPAGLKVAPMKPASTAIRPAFVTIAIRPSSLGRSGTTHTTIPNFGKAEYFRGPMLTQSSGVLPVGQRKIWWIERGFSSPGARSPDRAARAGAAQTLRQFQVTFPGIDSILVAANPANRC